MKRLFPIIAFLLLTNLLYSQTKPQTNLFLQTLDAVPGDQVCVDFTVQDFRFIEALGLSIRWDTTALQFTEYIISPEVSLTPNALNVLDDEGVLLMAWTIIPSLTLPDNSSILQLCFTVKETDISKFAYIAFDDRITPDVIVPEDLTGNPFVNATFHSGGIQIKPDGNEVTIAAQTVALNDCIGRKTSIDLTVTGGTLPYNFEWTGPNNFVSTDEDLEQLAEGYYEVLVYDQNGLQATGRFLIKVLENESEGVVFIEEAIITPTDCNAWEGSIQLNMIGETSDYTYSWNNGAHTSNLSNLPSGDYSVTITNNQGCGQIKNFAVEGFGNIIYNRISKDLSCNGSPTEIGVLLPKPDLFSFEWDTNDFTSTIEVEEAGKYYLTIDNGTYCLETLEFNVKYDVSTFDVDLLESTHLSCEDGTATIGITNINPDDYYIIWPQFETSDPTVIVNQPGTYAVEINHLDIEGCTREYTFEVRQAQASKDYEVREENLPCEGVAIIGLEGTEGKGYTFDWGTGATTPLIEVPTVGNYYLTLTEGNFCAESVSFTVDESSTPEFNLPRLDGVIGCGHPTDTIGVEVPENTNYTFHWLHNEAKTPSIEVAEAGNYLLEVRLGNCSEVFSFDVKQSSNNLTLPTPEFFYQCPYGGECGEVLIHVEAIGAEAPVIFSWSTGQVDTVESRFGQLRVANRYPVSVQIKDANGCTASLDNIIPECPEDRNEDLRLRAYFTCEEEEEEEEEGLATYIHAEMLNGGNPPYYFSWNSGVQDTSYFLSRLPFDNTQGTYSVTVTDQSDRQTEWSFQQTELYGCGPDSSAVYFEAPHMIVAPGSQFVYPVRIHQNFDSLARALFTVDWDNCLLKADSIVFHYPTRTTYADINLFSGTYEIYFQAPSDTILPDTVTIAEIFFQAAEVAEGISPFLFSINEPAYDFNEETAFLRPLHGSITVASQQALVLPGDADNNYSVDHFDLLNLGLFYHGSGPERRLGLLQEQEYGIPWLQQTYQSHTNLKHLDCNGDGSINAQDTNIIAMNWKLSDMAIEKSIQNEDGPAVFVTGDTLFPGEKQHLSIRLGEIDQPAVNIYGIALTIDYDEKSVLPESVYVDFIESWLVANSEVQALVISRNDPLHHRIHLAIVRANGENITGYGELAKLHLTTRADTDNRTAAFSITDVRLINSLEEFIPTNHRTSFLTVDQMTATREPDLSSYIKLYPVPAQDRLFIHHTPEISILRASIFELNGRRVQEQEYLQNHLDVARLPAGIYFLKLITSKGMVTKRWVKR